MTTSRFTHDLLFKKMGINMLASKPAFLFKIGESSVADTSGVDDMERNMFSNFLLVPIGKGIWSLRKRRDCAGISESSFV